MTIDEMKIKSGPEIRVLPDAISNRIAAGEVVERPASVVKELVENSLDAGATRITVEVERGGSDLIRISDNGHGMTRDNAVLSIQRYATSKIRDDSDLFSIKTFGFRGEAIPSIASVSNFTMITREAADLAASKIEISGGKVIDISETGAPAGTMIEVRNLYFNTPARRKFLKTVNTEMGHIASSVDAFAVSYPNVQFQLTHNRRNVKYYSESDAPMMRVRSVLGIPDSNSLYAVDSTEREICVRGHISEPSVSKGSAGGILLFVNGRAISDRGLISAILGGYKGRLMKGRFPVAALFVDVPFDEVDVNVHPAKLQVKFANQSLVFGAVMHAVHNALYHGEKGKGRSGALFPSSGFSPFESSSSDSLSSDQESDWVSDPDDQKNKTGEESDYYVQMLERRRQQQIEQLGLDGRISESGSSYGHKSNGPDKMKEAKSDASSLFDSSVSDSYSSLMSSSLPGEGEHIEKENNHGVDYSVRLQGDHLVNPIGYHPLNLQEKKREKFPEENKSSGCKFGDSNKYAERERSQTPYNRSLKNCEVNCDAGNGETGNRSFNSDSAFHQPQIKITDLSIIGQFSGTYIAVEVGGEMLMIDQHAAHERVVYERLKRRSESGKVQSQALLVPEVIEFNHRETGYVQASISALLEVGIEIEPFGGTSFVVKSVPAIIDEISIEGLLKELVERADEGHFEIDAESWLDSLLILIACHSSVRANQNLDIKEMRALIKDLSMCENPFNCPHGRPTIVRLIGVRELEKRFKRTGA